MSKDYISNEYKNKTEQIMKEIYKLGYSDGISDGNINNGTFYAMVKEAYNNGLNDAWEAKRKIVYPVEYGGLTRDELTNIFRLAPTYDILQRYSAAEAIEKIKEHESHVPNKDVGEIKVGDEIVCGDAHVVITYLDKNHKNSEYYKWNGMLLNTCDAGKVGGTYSGMTGFKNWAKTSKHYPQIIEVLRQMKGDSND